MKIVVDVDKNCFCFWAGLQAEIGTERVQELITMTVEEITKELQNEMQIKMLETSEKM